MKLWLNGAEPARKVEGVRALRDFAREFNEESLRGVRAAVKAWDGAASGHTRLMLVTDDRAQMDKATTILDKGGLRYDLTQDSEMPPHAGTPAPPEEREQEPPDDDVIKQVPGPQPRDDVAAQVALVLMAVTDGDQDSVLSIARTIARLLPDDPLWTDIEQFLLDTFPPSVPSSMPIPVLIPPDIA